MTQERALLVSMLLVTTQTEVKLILFVFGCLTGKLTNNIRINERLRILPQGYTQTQIMKKTQIMKNNCQYRFLGKFLVCIWVGD